MLAPLLEGLLKPLCLQPGAAGQAALRLAPGLLAEPNGIALLGELGFPPEPFARARSVHAWLGRQPAPVGLLPPRVPGPSGA